MKTSNFFILILFIATLSACKSTNYLKYYRNMNEAQFYFYQKDYKTARHYYEQGLKKVNTYLDRDLLYYASCLWKTGGDTQQVIAILDTNIYFSSSRLTYFKGMNDSLKNEIIKTNKLFKEQKENRFYNSPEYLLLDSLYAPRKTINKVFNEVIGETYNDSTAYYIVQQKLKTIDSLNTIVVDSLIQAYGYPGGVNWAIPARIPIHFMMMYSDSKWRLKKQKFLYKELKMGHLLPYDYYLYIFSSEWLYLKYCTGETGDLTPALFFKRANKIGLSPYFIFSDLFYAINTLPRITAFYEDYKTHKTEWNCVK